MSYFRGLFGNKEMRILILGLDGAGKTTLLYRLQVRMNENFFRKFYSILSKNHYQEYLVKFQ